MKPTPWMYVLQSLHGHLSGIQDLILFLNKFNFWQSFISFGTCSQIFGAKWDKLSIPPGWVLPYIMWRDVPPLRVYFSLISSPSVGILLRPFKEKSLSGCLFCKIWRRNPPDGILFTRFWGKSPSVGIKFCPECSSRYFVSLLFLSFEPQIPLRVSKLSHFSPSKLAH